MTETKAHTTIPSEQRASVPVFERAWTPFWMLRNDIDSLFDDFFRAGRNDWPAPRRASRASAPQVQMMVPSLDVIDKEDEVKLIADLPGLSEKDVDVQVSDSTLTISGEKKEEIQEGDAEGERYVSERRFGSFTRRISLPDGIDQDKISASFKNGVLTVHLPKRPEARHPARKIEVQAAT